LKGNLTFKGKNLGCKMNSSFAKRGLFQEVGDVIGDRPNVRHADGEISLLQNLSRLGMIGTPENIVSFGIFGTRAAAVFFLKKTIRRFAHSDNFSVQLVNPLQSNNRLTSLKSADFSAIDMSRVNPAYMRSEDLAMVNGWVESLHQTALIYDFREIGFFGCIVISKVINLFDEIGKPDTYDFSPFNDYLGSLNTRVFPCVFDVVCQRYNHLVRELSIRGSWSAESPGPAGEWINPHGTPINLYISSAEMEKVFVSLSITSISKTSYEYLHMKPKQLAYLATIGVIIFIVVLTYWVRFRHSK